MKACSGNTAWNDPQDVVMRVFIAVFVAEWGDRTQVAMVTLHSSAPWVPVCIGSMVAFMASELRRVLDDGEDFW